MINIVSKTSVGITLASLLFFIGVCIYSRIKHHTYYTHVWKKTTALKPEDILGFYAKTEHGFNDYYFSRQSDETIKKRIAAKKNVFITGKLLSGKSRSIYQALFTIEGKYDVIIPKLVDMKSVRVPWHFCFWRKKIVVLDDIDEFVKKQNFIYLFHKLAKKKTIIIASCRSGSVYDRLCEKLEREPSVFGEYIEISDITRGNCEKVASLTSREMPPAFDGSIGAIFLRLYEMTGVYRSCSEPERNILMSLRCLYMAGIYEERELFSIDRVKQLCCKKFEANCSTYDWEEYLTSLKNKGFSQTIKNDIWVVKSYLEYVIGDGIGTEDIMKYDLALIDNFQELTEVFAGDFKALFNLGSQAYHTGITNIRKTQYMSIVISAYEEALKVNMLSRRSMDYATLQQNIAIAYSAMAEKDDEEDEIKNFRRAVKAYEEAVRVKKYRRFPLDFAMIKYNLGYAYSMLAMLDIKTVNSKKAIDAYEEALKVYTIGRFPEEFTSTYNNLGYALSLLAEVEEKSENCKKAIKAYKKALKVRSQKRQSVEYATTQNNMGISLNALAEVEDKQQNCLQAIKAHEEALRVFKKEEYPVEYAVALTSIGNAYYKLAEVENQQDNCYKALEAYEEAIKYRTPSMFSLEYASILNNMGEAYCKLAEAEDKRDDKIAYIEKAIKLYQDALIYRTHRRFPIEYATTQNNLGTVYILLATLEYKVENCRKAINAHNEALEVYTPVQLPSQYANTKVKLGKAYLTLAEVEEKAKNCHYAIEAYLEANNFYRRENYTIEYALTCNLLGDAYSTLSEAEDKNANIKLAVVFYEEALKSSHGQLPMDYGYAWHRLGNAYNIIAEVEDKDKNLKKACQAYEEALKYYPIQSFALEYAILQNKLGHNYYLLADLVDLVQNSKKAINALGEALRVYTIGGFPMQFAATQNKLGNVYTTLARAENMVYNYKKAAQAYEYALTVFTKDAFPEVYQVVDRNLYRVMSMLESS